MRARFWMPDSRHLTWSPWDAEDLPRDTMSRAFAMSNLWLDHVRRPHPTMEPASHSSDPSIELRDAAGTSLVQLAPQERTAVVLEDAFDFSLDEAAGTLGTTVGAVKAALHRGRGKLREPDAETSRVPAHGAVDAFRAAFN